MGDVDKSHWPSSSEAQQYGRQFIHTFSALNQTLNSNNTFWGSTMCLILLSAKEGELNNTWHPYIRHWRSSLGTIWMWPVLPDHPPSPGALWFGDASLKAWYFWVLTQRSWKTCIQMLIAALFLIAETWKQPRCPSIDQWINCGASRQWNIIIQG